MLTVARLMLTPVKGLRMQSVESVHVTRRGVRGDRLFYLIDEEGRLVNGRRLGKLCTISAHYSEASRELAIDLPDGRGERDTVINLGHRIRTWFYDHSVSGRPVIGPWSALISDYVGLRLQLVMISGSSLGTDLYPLSFILSSTIASIRCQLGLQATMDHRCYRSSIELDGLSAFQEEGLIGATACIDGVYVRIPELIPRCVVVQQSPDTGVTAAKTLRLLVERRKVHSEKVSSGKAVEPFLGAYGVPLSVGSISVGAEVALRR